MRTDLAFASASLLVCAACHAATLVVANTNDAGTGSLRQAIVDANATSVYDTIIFAPGLKGKKISLVTPLPTITKICGINGDIDENGTPDIYLDGSGLSTGHGIYAVLPLATTSAASAQEGLLQPLFDPFPIYFGCNIKGLAIGAFPGHALRIYGGRNHVIQGCHLGADLTGNNARPCGSVTAVLRRVLYGQFGSTSTDGRNVVQCGTGEGDSKAGLLLDTCSYTRVIGNYIGVKRNGSGPLGTTKANSGVRTENGISNQIGGKLSGERNVIAGAGSLVNVITETDSTIQGNYLGLAPDGNTPIGAAYDCVLVWKGSTGNLIGGATAAAANVMCGDEKTDGVQFQDETTTGNRVQGNLMGSNATGTAFLPLFRGVVVAGGAGAETIGGSTPGAGNHIAALRYAVSLYGGNGGLVRNNRIGLRKDSTPQAVEVGISVQGDTMYYVRDNVIVRAGAGVHCGARGEARIYGNTFRFCQKAVLIEGSLGSQGVALLGNLGNSATNDDGGNLFRSSNTWFIYNLTSKSVRAEGNSFDSTSAAAIDAKIWDRQDDASLGRVDFRPLAGGVMPTAAPLTVASAAATATGVGAEVAFNLSAEASVSVEIVNVAGRVVATPLRDAAQEAGVQRVIWARQTLSGTRAPGGLYLARITARAASGEHVQALCRFVLR